MYNVKKKKTQEGEFYKIYYRSSTAADTFFAHICSLELASRCSCRKAPLFSQKTLPRAPKSVRNFFFRTKSRYIYLREQKVNPLRYHHWKDTTVKGNDSRKCPVWVVLPPCIVITLSSFCRHEFVWAPPRKLVLKTVKKGLRYQYPLIVILASET